MHFSRMYTIKKILKSTKAIIAFKLLDFTSSLNLLGVKIYKVMEHPS